MISWVVNSRLHLRQTSPRYARAPQSASPRNLRVRRLSRPGRGVSALYFSYAFSTYPWKSLSLFLSHCSALFGARQNSILLFSVDYALFTHSTRCQFHTSSGRQCRLFASDQRSRLCSYHLAAEQQTETANVYAPLIRNSQGLQTAQGINYSLSNLYELLMLCPINKWQ